MWKSNKTGSVLLARSAFKNKVKKRENENKTRGGGQFKKSIRDSKIENSKLHND